MEKLREYFEFEIAVLSVALTIPKNVKFYVTIAVSSNAVLVKTANFPHNTERYRLPKKYLHLQPKVLLPALQFLLICNLKFSSCKQNYFNLFKVNVPMICDALRDLVSFVQFKKRENTHGGVLLLVKLEEAKSATLLKVTLLHGCFAHFLNYKNGTKTRKTSDMDRSHLNCSVMGLLVLNDLIRFGRKWL